GASGVAMMDEDANAVFIAEAEGLVESLEERLLALQASPTDRGLIDGTFRDLHTLKGSGAMFGRDDIASFLHDFETAFESVRNRTVAVDDLLIKISLEARDHVAYLLKEPNAAGGKAILKKLAAHLFRNLTDLDDTWWLTFQLPEDTLDLGGRPSIVLDELRALGADHIEAVIDDVPHLDEIDPTKLYLGWKMRLPGHVSEDDVRAAFMFHEDGLTFNLARSADQAPVPDASHTAQSKTQMATPDAKGSTVTENAGGGLMRVPAERLDDLMDRVGELVIAEARLLELAAKHGDPALVSVAEDIQRLVTGMRETTMSIRMTAIGTISGRFRRLVHDLSSKLKRPILFTIEGEDTELDKTVVERLTEPLMHIIRNSADHGLEATKERVALGKPEAGEITLSARYSGADVLICVSDDGGGLEREAILARAIENGLLPEGAAPDDDELFALIFEPGFSTAQSVTELSGRGVGMDVVRRTIDGLRGVIEVQSEPGHGTTVTLRLPLTLAIIDGLLVETAGERFVIPLAAVDEIVELPDTLTKDRSGNAFLDIRDTLVPFLRMRRLLDSPGEAGPFQKVVVVTSSEGRVGLVVDRIIGSNQTVIKQLSPLHAGVKTFSGATILGDGSVALILDVPQLVVRGRIQTDSSKEAA
ncbi:chemotaxis protein CheA, partial [Celeribacter marinus]|uniref:chemotaxis protein CheA n=1 Tax=Celeribacter marinus TaxID=1397108 RepID=UPI003F6CCA65